MAKSKTNHKPRVAMETDKVSDEARCKRSQLVEDVAKDSELWKASKDIQAEGARLIAAGQKLSAKEKKLQSLLAEVISARQEILSARIEWDQHFRNYAKTAEIPTRKPEDLTRLALPVLERAEHRLLPPTAVEVTYDRTTREIHIEVHHPRGRAVPRIEISPDPATPDSFVMLKGSGARRVLKDQPLGRWWVRALMIDATDESAYSPLVSVEVT
jgi:hypothetical protein